MGLMKKRKSKMKTLKEKHVLKKKFKDRSAKARKIARLNPQVKQRRRDPGIPNLFPLKKQMLSQIQRDAEDAEEAKQQRRKDKRRMIEKAMQRNSQNDAMERVQSNMHMNKELKVREQEVEKRHWYYREMNNVIQASDVILEVLDARDPAGCRCASAELEVAKQMNKDGTAAKKLIIVLNKIDLVPPEAVELWMAHLKREYPVIAFKASTQKQKGNLQQNTTILKDNVNGVDLSKVSGAVGASQLMQLLKNYSRSFNIKTNITVGVIGFPNVGKSSIINSLKRQRSVNVGPTPGLTKTIQTVRLDGNISLVDSPGVIMNNDSTASLILQNCIRVESMEDPIEAATQILDRCSRQKLMKIYNIPEYQTAEQFLLIIAQRHNFRKQKGVWNLLLAARRVLNDWNEGKIPFFTMPPKKQALLESKVVSTFADKFDVGSFLERSNSESMAQMRMRKSTSDFVDVSAGSNGASMDMDEDEEEAYDFKRDF